MQNLNTSSFKKYVYNIYIYIFIHLFIYLYIYIYLWYIYLYICGTFWSAPFQVMSKDRLTQGGGPGSAFRRIVRCVGLGLLGSGRIPFAPGRLQARSSLSRSQLQRQGRPESGWRLRAWENLWLFELIKSDHLSVSRPSLIAGGEVCKIMGFVFQYGFRAAYSGDYTWWISSFFYCQQWMNHSLYHGKNG